MYTVVYSPVQTDSGLLGSGCSVAVKLFDAGLPWLSCQSMPDTDCGVEAPGLAKVSEPLQGLPSFWLKVSWPPENDTLNSGEALR